MIASNDTLHGGLYIQGKNATTGEEFSVHVPSGLRKTIDLTKGEWTFQSIGWNGQTTTNTPFTGTRRCGTKTQLIASDTESVTIDLNQSSCLLPEFDVRALSRIITCNTFYTESVSPTVKPINSLIPTTIEDNFCDTLSDKFSDLKSKVRGVRISTLERDLGSPESSLGITSACLSSDNSVIIPSVQAAGGLFLPFGNFPLVVQTYSDSTCSKMVAKMVFDSGLKVSHPRKFDHLLYGSRLFLPANEMKRALGFGQALLPSIMCAEGSLSEQCQTLPIVSAPNPYQIALGETLRLTLPGNICSQLSASAGLTASCSYSSVSSLVTLNTQPFAQTPEWIAVDGTPTYIDVISNSPAPYRSGLHATLTEFLGPTQPIPYTYFDPTRKQAVPAFGALSAPRQLLSSSGGLGLFRIIDQNATFMQNCLQSVGSEEVIFYDEQGLQLRKYRYELSNETRAVKGTFICGASSATNSGCAAQVFKKRLLKYDYAWSMVQPVAAMEFECDSRAGKLESQVQKMVTGVDHKENEILTWNTTGESPRFEFAKRQSAKLNGTNSENTHSMGRLVKTNEKFLELWSFKQQAWRVGSTYTEVSKSFQVKTKEYNLVASPNDRYAYYCFYPKIYTSSLNLFGTLTTSDSAVVTPPTGSYMLKTNSSFFSTVMVPESTCPLYTDVSTDKIFGTYNFKLSELNKLHDASGFASFSTGFLQP